MDRIGIVHRLFENRWLYSLKSKLIFSFLAISIIPLAAVVTLAYLQFQEALRSQASNQLVVVRDSKVKQVRSYLRRIEQDIKLVAQLPYVKTAMQQLEIGVRGQGLNQVRQMGFLGRPDLFYLEAYSPYAVYHAKYHAFFRELVQTKGYADIWLMSPEGDIIYTFAKRDDFATNLLQAPNQDTPPAQLFQRLLAKAETGRVQMTDYGVYPPAGDVPVSFIGAPILDEDKLVGCLIYQLSLDQINNLMQVHAGFWKTGETYLVGADYLARTKTLFSPEMHFFEQRVDSLAVRKGLMGESGVAVIEDYRGMPVLSAYQALDVNKFKWVLLAEVDKSEAFGPSIRLRKLMVGIVLVTTLLVIGVGFYIGRSIAKPIVELAETSTRIASGNLALRARPGARDEIGLLAEAFNSMTGRLSELIGGLKQQIAERKRADQALRTSEERFRTVVENSPIVVFSLDRNGVFTLSEGKGLAKLGLYPGEMVGKSVHDVYGQNPQIINKFTRALAGEDFIAIDEETGVNFETRWTPIGGEDGKASGVVGVSVDVTDRKRAEDALRKSAAEYRRIVDTANEGIWVLGPDALTTFVNTRMAEMLDYATEEILCLPMTDFMFKEDASAHLQRMEKRRNGISEHYELRFRRKDGQTVWTIASATPIFDREHGFQGSFAMFTDITERKQAEQALRDSRQRMDNIVANSPGAIYRCANDPEWTMEFLSAAITRITGYPADDFLNNRVRSYASIIHPDDRHAVEEAVSAGLERKDRYEIDYRLVATDGTPRWVHEQGQGVFAPDGRLLWLDGVIFDITDQRRAEEEIHKLNQELEQRVAERTVQLQAANKELEAFAYTVSHDLRAPLRHIDGFLELLQEAIGTALDEQGRHYMDAICEAARKMGLLIDDLLAFSRMGRHAVSFQAVALGDLVREVIAELSPEAAGREISWRIGDLPTVTGDAALLRMVLVNLIANAVKFTQPRKEARIEIGTLPGQDAQTVIFVRDNGVGFDMTYADKLFGVFQRLHRQEDFEGTGIGLATVRRIIARHGGRTWAEGQVNQGAAFYFSLPQRPAAKEHH